MLIKQSSLLSSASNVVLSRSFIAVSSTSSTFSRSKHDESTRPFPPCPQNPDRRRYATVSNGKNLKAEEHVWPKPPKGHSCPTPYQIFALKHGAQYRKARFYELVKIYHPDLRKDACSTAASSDQVQVSQQDKMERYRLIVAANAILSDPEKRRAYDRFGAGWAGRADFGSKNTGRSGDTSPFSQSWTQPNDPVWQNATWEDWERYYAARARDADPNAPPEPQGPLYLSNTSFVLLVGVLAILGSLANYNRAQDAGTYFVEQRDLVHDRAAKELRKVRQETAGLGGREERIQWFLRQREATLGMAASQEDIDNLREEKARRVLPNGDICRAADLSQDRESV
ncbi:Hypothetical protein R9X50_00010000 [Acrodontium crateriforme]|uniref:J domain-containing protein n=1 Tax=Acrodontium crateriforme TaxID=150365 RepID=A0AAQ3LWL6_9PEZI|nr:Hypothetical protein R9X50_00010000 [Acrodontium crateriforme]